MENLPYLLKSWASSQTAWLKVIEKKEKEKKL